MIWIYVLQTLVALAMLIPLYLMFKEVGHVKEYVTYLKMAIIKATETCQTLQGLIEEQKKWEERRKDSLTQEDEPKIH